MNVQSFNMAALASVAAVAFAAGRGSVDTPATEPLPLPSAASTAAESSRPLISASRAELRDVGRLSFVDSYRALAAATPETISNWVKDIEQINARPARWAALQTIFKVLGQIDSVLAKQLFLQLQKENRWVAMWALKDAAPPRALKDVVEVLESFDHLDISGCSYDLLRDVIAEWSDVDPLAVRQHLEKRPQEYSARYRETLLRRWAAYDPVAAREWLTEQLGTIREDDDDDASQWDRDSMSSAWIEGWFEHDRGAVLDHLVASGVGSKDGEPDETLLAGIFATLYKESPQQALQFIYRLPQERWWGALEGLGGVADRHVYNDADDSTRSPRAVAEWLLQFPPETWARGMTSVVREWSYGDANALFDWMEQLPPHQQLAVAARYKPLVTDNAAEEELQKVLRVGSKDLRDALLRGVVRGAGFSREEMVAALRRSGLPGEQQMELAALIPNQSHDSDE